MIYLYDSTETDFRYNGKPLPTAYDVTVSNTLNSEYYVMGKYPLDKDKVYKEIVEDRIIKVHTMDGMEPFRIVNVSKRELYVEFEAWPLFYADMRNKLVKPLNLTGVSGQTALNAFKNNLLIDTPFDFYSDITDNHDYHTQGKDERENNSKQLYNALDVFKTIVGRWGGELWIRGYDIRVNKRIGTDTEAMLYEKKNITEFVDTTNIEGIVTRLHGKSEWQDEPQEGEEGQKHSIETTVNSPLINSYSGVVFEKQYTNNAIRTEQALKNWLNLKFTTENIDKPQRTIEVGTNVIDGMEIGFADTLILKYIKHDTDVRIKVVGYEYDGFANELKHVVLGQPKHTSSSTIGNTITDLVNNVVDPVDRKTTIAMNSADGKSTVFHGTADPNTLNLNAKENDPYFRTNGNEKEIWRFTGTLWELTMDTSETTKNADAIAEQQQEIEEAKQTADEAVEQIDTAVANAGFTSLDETISSVQAISNQAQINAGTAIDNALEAMQQASQAVDNTGSLNIRVDEVENTLSVKADKQTVDELTGVVDAHALDIQANAEGLALKANQDTVDTLAGTVQSLGTEFDIVAGQVSSRVWNTDIETAIDGLEYENRNLAHSENITYRYGTLTGNSTKNISGTGLWYIEIQAGFLPNTTYTISNKKVINDGSRGEILHVAIYDDSIRVLVQTIGSFSSGGIRTFTTPSNAKETDRMLIYISDDTTSANFEIHEFKLEKSNKATVWTPAPEDTTALINHVESELTQKYDSITATVSSIDGRVATNKLNLDGLTTTVQSVRTDLTGTTTLLNTTRTTVNGHTSTIATLRTDVDGKATTTQFNTLNSTVNGTITRVGNAEGKITQIETNVSGLQTTVASKASQSEVTQLATGLSSVVTDLSNLEIVGRNILRGTGDEISGNLNTIYWSDLTTPLEVGKYQFQFIAKSSVPISAVVYFNDNSGQRRVTIKSNVPINLTTEYSHYSGTIEVNKSDGILDDDIVFRIYNASTTAIITIAPNSLKVEKGNKATDWTLAPEDVATQSQITQLQDNINLRVTKGDVLSQINIEADRMLFQSGKLLFDAENVVFTGTAWMDGAVIANASIDGAKITDATIGSAKIAELDVGKISGNTTSFVQSEWNNITRQVAIDDSGINVSGHYNWRYNSLNETGLVLYGEEGSNYKAGAIGYFLGAESQMHPNQKQHVMYNYANRHSISIGVNSKFDLALGTSQSNWSVFNPSINIRGEDGRIEIHKNLMAGAESGYGIKLMKFNPYGFVGTAIRHFELNHAFVLFSPERTILSSESLLLFTSNSGSTAFMADYKGINLDGNDIFNHSDRRLKTKITQVGKSSLETIKKIVFHEFDWIKNGRHDLGVIAQEVINVAPDLVDHSSDGYLSINNTKLNMMTTHAVKELALREENTNEVASQALQLGESNEDKIKRLEKRIEELEGAI